MADDTVLPTAFVYGTHLINPVSIGLHPTPVSLSNLMTGVTGHPININTTFANPHKQVFSPTNIASGPQTMFVHQPTIAENEPSAAVSSPVTITTNTGTEWKQSTGQKRQRRSSTNDNSQNPSTPTKHTPTTNQVYEWNNPTPDTNTAPPLTPTTSDTIQSMLIPSSIMTSQGQILPGRPCSTPVTPTGTPTGLGLWPGINRQLMMKDTHTSQSIDYSDAGSDDSSDTPQSKIPAGDWTQTQNGSLNTSLPQTPTSTTDASDPNTPGANDAEGVWSPDIEQAFQEALAIYPPCGRRKIILSDEGKMYGRNELIARYIKLRTGKSRSRKQVSSHIQVLAKKKAREIQGKIKDPVAKDKAMANLSSMSSAQIVSASSIHRPNINLFPSPGIAPNAVPMGHMFASGPVNPITIKQEPSLMWHPSGHALVQQPHALPTHFQNLAGGMIPISLSLYPSSVGQIAVPSSNATIEPGRATNSSPILTNQSLSPIEGGNSIQDRVSNPNSQPTPLELPLKLVEFCAFVESQSTQSENPRKHIFAQITDANFNDQDMETIDISHIRDKFPEKSGGLRDLYEKGPPHAFFLVKFWGNVNTPLIEEPNCFYGVSSRFEGSENKTITCSTKVCSFGTQVVEKVETEYAKFENSGFVYRINRSPMCEYILNFIQRLYNLPENYMMNNVLEHFTILQVVSDRDTQETLICLAYLFEVNSDDNGNKFRLYRLTKGN
ncbi:Transcriptional enhancer factor TEF-1-like [Oopsacas minuta]|uniref:Transcriptional enhancer factor TEF-1-like n=1 Tax=Oopsacas minuta TaxID=111878 RepID=A0AAV7KB94_9METZ|nr:Transcriptional enhancer factor TEF-1-like [Oopsacas minuta]